MRICARAGAACWLRLLAQALTIATPLNAPRLQLEMVGNCGVVILLALAIIIMVGEAGRHWRGCEAGPCHLQRQATA